MLDWILIIIAGYVYIRNQHESANENTWCWGLCSLCGFCVCGWFRLALACPHKPCHHWVVESAEHSVAVQPLVIWDLHDQVKVQYMETICFKPTLLDLTPLTSSKWESALVLVHRLTPVRQSGRLLLPLMNLIHIWRRHTGMWKISISLFVNGRSLQSQSSKQIQLQIGKKKTFPLHLPPVWSVRGLIWWQNTFCCNG